MIQMSDFDNVVEKIRVGEIDLNKENKLYVFKIGNLEQGFMPTQKDINHFRELLNNLFDGKEVKSKFIITHPSFKIKEYDLGKIQIEQEKNFRLDDIE